MGRRLRPRYEKNFFDPTLAVIGGDRARYVDAFHKHAGHRIQLHNLTRKVRGAVNMAGVERIADDAVIHGIQNTDICKPVTLETLTSRMGVAKAIWQATQPVKQKMNYRKLVRAQLFTQMHEPFLGEEGPFQKN
jgi:hypothetical protein